ncbi:MAG: hypothetical protein ACLSVX_02140 [Massilimicrobiota timonensis]
MSNKKDFVNNKDLLNQEDKVRVDTLKEELLKKELSKEQENKKQTDNTGIKSQNKFTYYSKKANTNKFTTLFNGYNIATEIIKQAGISDDDLNNILKRTYGNTDKLLAEKLKNSFEILEKREKTKQFMKKCFFWIIMFIFCILTLSPIILFIFMYNRMNNLTFLISIIGSLVELTLGILILPKIIAQYLFNKDEDKLFFDLIKELKAYHDSKKDKF